MTPTTSTLPRALALFLPEPTDQIAISALIHAQAHLDGPDQNRARGLLASLVIERIQVPVGTLVELSYDEIDGDYIPTVNIEGAIEHDKLTMLKAAIIALQEAWRPFSYGEIIVGSPGRSRACLS